MNNIYQQYQKNNMDSMLKRFGEFRKNFAGDPQQMIQNMLKNGRITQEQYEQAIQTANEFMKLMK